MTTKFCSAENCPNPARSRGMCPKHYRRSIVGFNEREDTRNRENPPCDVSHCIRPSSTVSGGLCASHYQIQWRGVDPETRILRPDGKTRATCWVGGCAKPVQTHSLCNYHSRRARTGKLSVPENLGVKLNPPCQFEGCLGVSVSKGLCHSHYCQLRGGGNLSEVRDYGKYTLGEHICEFNRCKKPAVSKGYCEGHSSLRTKYGLSVEEFRAVWENPVCQNPACDNKVRLHMDHDHETGKFRGLLCNGCNTALGLLKENVDRIRGLAGYKVLHG